MKEKEASKLRAYVRERYGKAAEQAGCGCGPDPAGGGCCSTGGVEVLLDVERLYSAPDVHDLPEETRDLALGCGDPVTLATLAPGERVLDLGSGGGIDCFLAGRRVGTDGRVIGVDMTPEMLDRARATRAKLGIDNVEFRLGEIEHLPVPDNDVDVVISNCVINLSPEKHQVFREAFRVLKPGGRLAVSDIVTGGPLPDDLKADLAAWAGCVAGAWPVEDYVAAIQAAGFEDVEVRPVYMSGEMIAKDVRSVGLGGRIEAVDPEELAQAVFSAKVRARKPGP
jgi:arsenite methyltransferase